VLAGAAGNPFLAVELVRNLLDDHRLAPGDGVVDLTETAVAPTPALSDELVARLARRALVAVPGGDLVLRAVAAVPGGLTVDELAALLDQPLGELVAATLAAVDAAVLVDGGTTLTFRHDLLRQAVLGATPPSIVGALRRRAAAVLLDQHAPAERLAACLLADDPGDRLDRSDRPDPPDPAGTDRLLAIGRSLKKRNPDAAADLLRRALDGIGHDDPRSLPTTIELGWALAAAGRAREVGPLIQARAGRADPGAPVPVELVRLESVALSLAGRLGEASACFDDLDLSRLVDDLDASDPEVVDAAAELAFLRTTSGRLEEAARLVDWVDGSPTPDSAFRRAASSTVRAWLAGTVGAFEDAAEWARAALRAVDQDDSLAVTAGSPLLALGLVLDGQGDGDAALAVFRGREALAGPPRWAPPLLQFGAALALFRRGEWDDAVAEAEAGLLAAEETGLGLGAFWPCSIGTLVNCARGELAEAQRWLDRSWAITPRHELGIEWLLYATAALREAEGHIGEAATILDLMARGVLDAGAPALLLNGGTDMVRLALATGRNDSADLVAAELDAMTHRTASPVVAAMALWARGLVAADPTTTGAPSGGTGGWRDIERAAESLAGCGRVPEAARARHDAAVRAVQGGEPAEARRLASDAFAVYDGLDAQHLHRRLRSELRAHDLVMRPRRSRQRPRQGWESLTASESTIVVLVGQGLTNTQIAERLYVSRRTVESHLGRVYAKLDLSTRAQLVVATARPPAPAADRPGSPGR
jgi:DNA-binding CsgD family transcriptional regulator